MVNILELFSTNEEIEEISSESIRYFILPALLAYFTLRKTIDDRLHNVKLAEEYYNDFYKLCSQYKFPDIPSRIKADDNRKSDVQSQNEERSEKIRRYKEQKSIQSRLEELQNYVDQEHVDEEVKREYYTQLVRKWAYFTCEEMDSISTYFCHLQCYMWQCLSDVLEEVPILEMMKQHQSSNASQNRVNKVDNEKINYRIDKRWVDPLSEPPPLRPFILTRTALEAQVFGAGYPSLPTYSIEEYCEMQRRQGLLPDSGGLGVTSQSKMNTQLTDEEAAELKRADEDDLEDKDDEDALRKKREWDNFKDDCLGFGLMSKGRSGVQFVKNEEPSFIKQFKEKAGVKSTSADLQDKFNRSSKQHDDEFVEDRDDEKPQIVIPEGCNLSEEDAQKIVDKQSKQETEDNETESSSTKDGRLLFRKPQKRKSDSDNEKEKVKKKQTKSKMKPRMLSFDDAEYDDDTT